MMNRDELAQQYVADRLNECEAGGETLAANAYKYADAMIRVCCGASRRCGGPR